MIPVVSNSQMRTLDKKCISEFGIPGIVLMENAGRNAADSIIDFCEINEIDSVMLFAGKGNNGGDGFVVARYLQKVGLDIEIHLCSPKNSISGDAAFNGFHVSTRLNVEGYICMACSETSRCEYMLESSVRPWPV